MNHRISAETLLLLDVRGFEGGGFGVGTDVEYAGAFRLDWKPLSHFGLTGGYNYLYFNLADERAGRTFTVKQTLHGPVVGIGLYF